MKICVCTKRLDGHMDEGIVRVAWEIIRGLANSHEVLTLFCAGHFDETHNVKRVPANPFGLSRRLRVEIRSFAPDIVFYVPRATASPRSFLYARFLSWYGNGAPVVILAIQPNEFAPWSRKLASALKPSLVLTSARKTQAELIALGCDAQFIPLGVDLDKFTPAQPDTKLKLRKKYGFAKDDYLVLHVGHISESRNIGPLLDIQRRGNRVVVVGSTFFPHDRALINELQKHGVTLFTGYFDRIEEIYQMADCYVFPTVSENGCISQPLSVLEAMACNLPVVSTRFGGLPDLFPTEQDGLVYGETAAELVAKVEYVRDRFASSKPGTRQMAEQYSWEETIDRVQSYLYQYSPAAEAGNLDRSPAIWRKERCEL